MAAACQATTTTIWSNPSPWPFVGSVSAFVTAVGAHHVDARHHCRSGCCSSASPACSTPCTPGGATSSTRRSNGRSHPGRADAPPLRHDAVHRLRGDVLRRLVLGLFRRLLPSSTIPSSSARVAATGGVWPPTGVELFDPFHLPLFNTLLLLTSGTTVTWAHHALLHNDREGLKWGLVLTIAARRHCSPACRRSSIRSAGFAYSGNIYGATFFMATGFHGFHVIIGTIFLIVCLVRAQPASSRRRHHLGFEFAAWYWHFVDVVWLFLFASIYVWGSWGVPVTRLSRVEGAAGPPPPRTYLGAQRWPQQPDQLPSPFVAGLKCRCPRCGRASCSRLPQARSALRKLRPRLCFRR